MPALAGTAPIDENLGVAHIRHALEHPGDLLTLGVQTNLAIHINGQSILSGMDRLAQLLALIHKVHHKLDHIGDPVRKLRGRGIV